MNKKHAAIIGHGRIGHALHTRLLDHPLLDVTCVRNTDGWFTGTPDELTALKARELSELLERVQIGFVTIPTNDDGVTAQRYIMEFLERKIPVVTCEKGALANHLERLHPHLDRIGYSATVGGGSGIIDFLRNRVTPRTQEVHVILNGTVNYVWSRLQQGNSLSTIVKEAAALGYTEPGDHDPVHVVINELEFDVPKKTAILFNACFHADPVIKGHVFALSSHRDIHQAIREARNRRFMVSFYRSDDSVKTQQDLEMFRYKNIATDWYVNGGFRSLDNPIIARLCAATPGVDNGALIVEGEDGEDGIYLHTGPGAGAPATTSAMLRDAERLLA